MLAMADFLDQLARQLKTGKSPAWRRSIKRILALMKVKFAAGLYKSQTEAEAELRQRAEAIQSE
jgi:hypothetical protein